MGYMYELDYTNLNIDKEKFMANLEEINYKKGKDYDKLEAIFKRLGDGENISSILDECKLIYKNGIQDGYGKFVFYSDTKQFFHENKENILDYLDDMAYRKGGYSQEYSIVDIICENSRYKKGYLEHGKEYLEEFIRDPEMSCGRLYNMLVWMYIQDLIDSLMEEESEYLLKGAIK